jgi:hypothetical protein
MDRSASVALPQPADAEVLVDVHARVSRPEK